MSSHQAALNGEDNAQARVEDEALVERRKKRESVRRRSVAKLTPEELIELKSQVLILGRANITAIAPQLKYLQ